MSDERYTIFRAGRFTPAQAPGAVINNRLGLATYLITGKVWNVSSLKRLAKHLQRVKKTVQLFPLDIRGGLKPQGELLTQRWRQAYAMDIQEVSCRQIAQKLLLAKHTDRI